MKIKIQAMLPEALLIGGALSVAYGAWLLHPAAGFMVGGVLALVSGVMAARKGV